MPPVPRRRNNRVVAAKQPCPCELLQRDPSARGTRQMDRPLYVLRVNTETAPFAGCENIRTAIDQTALTLRWLMNMAENGVEIDACAEQVHGDPVVFYTSNEAIARVHNFTRF